MIMVVKKKFKKFLNQKGQSIFEFILFVPFLLTVYGILVTLGGALNGSINQLKATRGYMKFRMQNNSYVPKRGSVPDNLKIFGMYAIGWADDFIGGSSESQPLKTCYKFSIPSTSSGGDDCKTAYPENTTQFIRVGTVLGLCGATYLEVGGEYNLLPDGVTPLSYVLSPEACQLKRTF